MNRSKKILLAAALATGFLFFRLVYAFVFSGLAGDGVLFELPKLKLSGPFSHITLLGDVSAAGIARNLEISLPFALTIFTLGTLAAFVGPAQINRAAKIIPPLKNILSSVAISLVSLPALFDNSRSVLWAMKLRGEKKRRAILPILERTLEFANAIGLKLALTPSGSTNRPQGLSIRNLEVPDIGLGPLNLKVRPGQIVVISGATGSGKTSLLEAIAGVSSEYRARNVQGEIIFGKEPLGLGISEIANFLSYIPQNPRELIWGFSVDELLASAPRPVMEQLGLDSLSGRSTLDLSEGEALKVLLAESLSKNPSILLLDEPYSVLDAKSRLQLSGLLAELALSGTSIVVTEHEIDHIADLETIGYHLESGALLGGWKSSSPAIPNWLPALVGRETVLRVKLQDIGFGEVLIRTPSLELEQAECVWLSGDNGSGKTSLLKALVGSDNKEVLGQRDPGKNQLVLVPESFDDFFVTDSLERELQRADKISGVPAGFTLTSLRSILPEDYVASILTTHPRDLSRGTRLALAIAMQLSHKPQVLLIDEPFRGLDDNARAQLTHTLRCVLETGCAILFASHETHWSGALANRRLVIENRELREVSEARR